MMAMKRLLPFGQIKITKTEIENGDGEVFETKPVEKNRRGMEPAKGKTGKVVIKYRECMRNHAASIGRHANDGCREFMPDGKEGTREAVRCGACGCHRNFHRKEQSGDGAAADNRPQLSHPPPPAMYLYNAAGSIPSPRWEKNLVGGFPPIPPHSLPQASPPAPPTFCHQPMFGGVQEEQNYERRSERPEVQMGTVRNKRFRTKFTQEQKDKMLGFAEKLGWRIQRHDSIAVNEFCLEVGVKREVFKVWMHNNKDAPRRKENAPPPPPPTATGV